MHANRIDTKNVGFFLGGLIGTPIRSKMLESSLAQSIETGDRSARAGAIIGSGGH